MLFLKHLNIVNYKNLREIDLQFDSKYVCFTGNNGAGKTNLLDAIYYLSIGKSYFNGIDQNNIKHQESYFNLKGSYEKNETEEAVFCAFVNGKKKKIKRNGKDYEKLSDHIGVFPVVIVTPYDNQLITGASEERRRFLDIIISQIDQEYLGHLMRYNKTVKQRNAQLRFMFENEISDATLIDIYDRILGDSGTYIFNKRSSFIENFSNEFLAYYEQLSQAEENVSITYKSDLNDRDLYTELKNNFRKDLIANRTTFGIHKDDIELNIFGHPAKKFASQGQQKSFLLALKLAQYKLMEKHRDIKPILLLDDVFDRLDRDRIQHLMEIISQKEFGQTFLTDTNSSRLQKILKPESYDNKIFEIVKGSIVG